MDTSLGYPIINLHGRSWQLEWVKIPIHKSEHVLFRKSLWFVLRFYVSDIQNPDPCVQYILMNLGMSTNFGTVDLEHVSYISDSLEKHNQIYILHLSDTVSSSYESGLYSCVPAKGCEERWL